MIQRADHVSTTPRSPKGSGASGRALLLFGVALAARLGVAGWCQSRGLTAALPMPGAGPLVPWLHGVLERVGGSAGLATLVVPCALGALAVLLLLAVGERLYGSVVAWTAGGIAALDPLLLLAAARLPVDAALAALATLALLASIEWIRTPQRGRAFGAGMLWGVAALAHPLALWAPPGLIAWAWTPLGLTVIARERAIQLAMFVAGLLLVVAPWCVTASIRAGHVVVVAGAAATTSTIGERLAHTAIEHATSMPGDPLAIWSWITLPLAAWGFWSTLSGPRRWFQAVIPLLAILFAAGAATLPSHPHPRTVVEPLLVLLAAAGIENLRRRRRARAHGLTVVEGTARNAR